MSEPRPPHIQTKELEDRDRLWCLALLGLPIDYVQAVTSRFIALRDGVTPIPAWAERRRHESADHWEGPQP